MADSDKSGLSPKEEGELEDGEISDADSGGTPDRGAPLDWGYIPSQRAASRRYPPARAYQLKGAPFRSPSSGSTRTPQQCENKQRLSFWERSSTVLRYRGGSRGRGAARGGPHKPYWAGEREAGRDWSRGAGGGDKPGRNFGGNNNGNSSGSNWREASTRKFKNFGRSPIRKPGHSSKNEGSGDETYEDLLVKYQQIKLELKQIKKDEKLALITKQENVQQEGKKSAESQDQYVEENSSVAKDHKDFKVVQHFHKEAKGIKYFNKDIKAFKQMNKNVVDFAKDSKSGHKDNKPEIIDLTEDYTPSFEDSTKAVLKELPSMKKNELKPFQAFEIKPLRQKLTPPIEHNNLENKLTVPVDQNKPKNVVEAELLTVENEPDETSVDQEENGASCESNASDPAFERVLDDEEEISELHLRLLALQSASKKWYEKEQEVMKESKEKLTTPKTLQQKVKTSPKLNSAKKVSPSYAAKQALRKLKTKAWLKLQQEKEQERRRNEEEEQKQAEEEESRKREEEIRKIRDLSNQEEQYNRFMKLVGGKRRSKDKFSELDIKRLSDKQSTDGAGGIYQYDNYEEVAMDTDSETNSPASSPIQPTFYSDCCSDCFAPLHQGTMQPVMSVPPVSQVYVDGIVCLPLIPPPPPPPLPPEEPEQPPKPPFADEEEEEEMLLREELLKSLLNKRTYKQEETSVNNDTPSPPNDPVMHRINLSAVIINSVSVPRKTSNKVLRMPKPKRQVISLPKHKSVVVTLNNDSDSESDAEPSNSNTGVFGGLEFMIKEARRTAEASKPSPKSEKENDPMRTPEALSEDKKMEYRLLKEEIASREKHRCLKSEYLKTNLSPANSDVEIDGTGRMTMVATHVTEAEAKHWKHKILLMKDESVLKHLLQQEAKKKETVRLAETKMSKLSEQMQATEKILTANKLFFKKLQEQIHKVQQRILVKKTLALKYGEELARAKALASQEIGKRKLEQDHIGPNKMLKKDHSPASSPKKHPAELIAMEKKRLQKLEQEYAQKIQKLKEAHGLKIKEPPVESITLEEEPDFVLPQPSLHDLTQDKITIDTEENDIDDEIFSISTRERRRSFRESSSFTKPNLKHSEATPIKETLSKPIQKSIEAPELIHGLNIDELKKLHAKADSLTELFSKNLAFSFLLKNKRVCGKEFSLNVDIATTQTKHTEIKPFPFGPYHSPLLVFKSYRFSPYFRTKERLYLSSVSYSNMIEPKKCFCRFDLTGTCNDDDCQWQHMRDCTLSRKELFQDILSYNPALIGCTEKSSDEEIDLAAEKYVDRLFGVNRNRMSMDQMAVLLVSKINESKNHTPPHTTWKDRRHWRPKYWRKPLSGSSSSSSDDEESAHKPTEYALCTEHKSIMPVQDAVVTPEDVRYFTNETDDISNLEASVLENPSDVQLWIKLAYKYLNQADCTSSECLDSTLNVLARALEHNRDNTEIWCHYLKLFSKRGSKEEAQEMCETAVEYAPSYQIWWTFLNLENSFDGKDYVCGRMLKFLMKASEGSQKSEPLSFQLLETLLLRVQISLFTGRHQNAVALLQNALKSTDESIIAEHLTPEDRCMAWLAYVHLIEFNELPANFYDPANSNPSRIVNRELFLIPWQVPQDVKTNPDMLLAVFEDAIGSCTDETLAADKRITACLPLYTNLIALQKLLDRCDVAVGLCETLLDSCPSSCKLLESVVALYLHMEEKEKACTVWLKAFKQNPQNAQLCYCMCNFLASQERVHEIPLLIQEFVSSFFECVKPEHGLKVLICALLRFQVPLDVKAPSYNEGLTDEFLKKQTPYLWLIYCLWQSVHGSSGDAVDAFETALGAVMQLDTLQQLWMDYLVFTNRKVVGPAYKVQEFKNFTDLLNRCLVTVPTRQPIPFSAADYWTNYDFHNRVVSFYLSCIPKSQHSKLLERFCSMMPTNPGLALRLLQEEYLENNDHVLKLQAKMFTYNIPSCMAIWKIAIAVECSLKGLTEVHHLYQRALLKIPLCASLWKDQLLFEASGGGKTDNLRKLVSKCQDVGVSLDELLNLNTSHTESSNH